MKIVICTCCVIVHACLSNKDGWEGKFFTFRHTESGVGCLN